MHGNSAHYGFSYVVSVDGLSLPWYMVRILSITKPKDILWDRGTENRYFVERDWHRPIEISIQLNAEDVAERNDLP